MNNTLSSDLQKIMKFPTFVIIVCYLLVLVVNGAIPGLTMPTLGQALWVGGFANSIANADQFSIWAYSFGAPHPTALAFGLPVAMLVSGLIYIGIQVPDAYSLGFAIWFLIAFLGAMKALIFFKISLTNSVLGATLWLILPIVWKHSGYSALSLSMALLPTYFYGTLIVFRNPTIKNAIIFIALCILSLFMDGYGFMFFVSISAGYTILNMILTKKLQLKANLIMLVGLLASYVSYTSYIGVPTFKNEPLDFFRGWGMDLSFALIPTKGVHWIPDLLFMSTERVEKNFFGDGSTFQTSFSMFLIAPALILFFTSFGDKKAKLIFLLMMVVGFYMALGPSFKLFSYRPDGMGALMPAELSLGPTGTGIISENVPGFNILRASYRWIAVAFLGAWLLTYIALSDQRIPRKYAIYYSIFCLAIALPHPKPTWDSYKNNRIAMNQMQLDFKPLLKLFGHREKVAFLPIGNDFLINYLSTYLGIIAYNIGGDKNAAIAKSQWPIALRKLDSEITDNEFLENVHALLESGDADALAISKLDLLWAAHKWPYPIEQSEKLRQYLNFLDQSDKFKIVESKYFQIIRLRDRSDFVPQLKKIDTADCIQNNLCIENFTFEEKPQSQVGVYKNKLLSTEGKSGYLHFGPYTKLKSGTYHVKIYGKSVSINKGFIDIISENNRIHLRQSFSKIGRETENILYSSVVKFRRDVSNLEIRVYVEPEDELILEGYTFELLE